MSIQTLVEKIKEKGKPDRSRSGRPSGVHPAAHFRPQHDAARRNAARCRRERRSLQLRPDRALCDIVPAVKPQAAYYELLGSYGAMALKETIDYAHAKGMYVIGDIKRNDIGATATAYAEAYLARPASAIPRSHRTAAIRLP